MPDKKRPLKIFPIAISLLVAVLLCCLVLSVEAERISPLLKLDPGLKPYVLRKGTAAAPSIIHQREPGLISAMIKVSGNPMSLESAGATVHSVIGDIVTVDVPLSSLNSLINLSNVKYIQASRQMQPTLLDVSVPDTKADQVWRSAAGYTGKDVIVGTIDGGIDWRHPDFAGSDGTTRILYIWDQTVRSQGQYPKEYRYGVEWTKEQIDSGQCKEMDATGHGTHTTSTAAGNGRDSHGLTGVAPEADIIAVKTSLEDTDVINAVSYIFRRADELNRPAVINMSFGSHWGPHDGTDMLDQAMDELLGDPGRAIVASAGNDGSSPIHLGTSSLRQPVGENYPWVAMEPLVGAEVVVVQVWVDPGSSLSVRFLLPENENGDLGHLGMDWVSQGQTSHFIVPSGPLAGAEVVIDAQLAASPFIYPNFDSIYIHIYNNDDVTIPIDEYIYAVEFDGPGTKLDAYVMWRARFTANIPSSISTPSRSYLMSGDGNKTIISPSSASSIICIGSYVTKAEWIDSDNRIRNEILGIGNLSIFSSRGPLLDGGLKPDIAAPGEMIVAAFSSDSWDKPKSVYRDGEHAIWRGTSMSSPHVAGAIALLYQQNPNLTALEVKRILNDSAIDKGSAGWDKAWGHGKMDVLAALGIPATPGGLRATARDGSIDLTWFSNSENNIAGYNIYTRSGDGESSIDAGKVTSYQLTGLANGAPIYVSVSAYDADGDEGAKTQEISVVPTSSEVDVIPPAVPEGLTAIYIDSALDLAWSRNTEHDLSRYKIYYGTSAGNYSNNISVGKSTSYKIKSLSNGVRIYAAVSSIDISGNESGKSREVSAVPSLFQQSALRYQSGWPESVEHDVYSSPALYDVNNDGSLEVAVSSKDGKVHLFRYDSSDMPGWPRSTDSACISSPALGDIDNDGRVEVVVGAGDSIYAWRSNGTLMPGWPIKTDDSVMASPALGDIDNDGNLEIVISSRDGRVYVFNSDGTSVDGWPVMTFGSIRSSAALGDIDGDLRLEIVLGSEDGDLYAFNSDGTLVSGWPKYLGSAANSSPALGDIDGDGKLEIVAASENGLVYAWRYDGELMDGWPANLRESIASSPALGDVDNDKNNLEIAIGTRYGTLYVLNSDGSTMDGWPVSIMDSITASPALGDINGDGKPDIVVASETGPHYIGLIYAFRNTGRSLGSMWPVFTEGNICNSSPALGDLDGDGDVELVVGSCRLADGTGGRTHVWDLTGRITDGSILWGGFRHDPQHTGVAQDTLSPSFSIATLQNAVLNKYTNIYVIASEQLIGSPDLMVEVVPSDAEAEGFIQPVPLVQIDENAGIYQASFFLGWAGQYTFTVSGTDANGNAGSSSKTISMQATAQTEVEVEAAPANFSLLPNYPNPFNPGTWIPYRLPQTATVTIGIYSISGELIRSLNLGRRAAGSYITQDTAAYWDGTDDLSQNAASGLYFCVLEAGDFKAVRKMLLLK